MGYGAPAPVTSALVSDPEPTLTPLGLTDGELAQALGRYRLRLHALIRAVASTAPPDVRRDPLPALQELDALVDGDIRARAVPTDASRMSDVERAVLVPLLTRLKARLRLLAHGAPETQWIALLHAADEDVARAERTLVGH
jgi:hypothetical protein